MNSKWVFRIKEDGLFKARLVIKGYEQEYNIDYHETFSPVVDTTALRLLLAYSAQRNFKMVTFDIKTAFLYGDLHEEIYMFVPEGFEEEGKICKLKRSLYGLKQASFEWNNKFSKYLESKGLFEIKVD